MTHIAIAVSPSRFLRWHQQLKDSIAARWPGAEVSFRLASEGDRQAPVAARPIEMERLLLRPGQSTLCDRLDPPAAGPQADADIVVDLAGDSRLSKPRMVSSADWRRSIRAWRC